MRYTIDFNKSKDNVEKTRAILEAINHRFDYITRNKEGSAYKTEPRTFGRLLKLTAIISYISTAMHILITAHWHWLRTLHAINIVTQFSSDGVVFS